MAVALVLSPVLRRSGWPLNQGTTAPLLLVQIYAAHFRHLDFLPVWSSSDGIGMGSPVLLYYHRTFFSVAGLIYALFGGLKASVIATLAIFLAVGACGMRRALGLVTKSRLLCSVGSVGFLFTNYLFTDWLDPRGDLAEFSALMLIPWLLAWCLTLVRRRHFSFSIIPIMALLVITHSAVALTSLFALGVAFVTFLGFTGLRSLRAVGRRVMISVAGTTLLVAPTLWAQVRFSRAYDPQTKNDLNFKASQQFVRWTKYLYDGMHGWFAHNQVPPLFNFVQVDFAIWVPIAAAATATAVLWLVRRRRGPSSIPPVRAGTPVLVFLLASLAVYSILQLRITSGIYRLVSPLQVINFPWRMLAFITPLGVIVVIVIADDLMRRYPMRSSGGRWLRPGSRLWSCSRRYLRPYHPCMKSDSEEATH